MSFFEQYRSGNLVLPNALFFHFKDIFPSADDFLVWQFLYLQTTTQIGVVLAGIPSIAVVIPQTTRFQKR